MNTSALGFNFGHKIQPDEKLVSNCWLTTIYGRALNFGELGVFEMASISRNSEQHGVVMALTETDARIGLGTAESFTLSCSEEQREVLEQVSRLRKEMIPNRLKKKVEVQLPALALAKIAITDFQIYFRDGHARGAYERLLRYWRDNLNTRSVCTEGSNIRHQSYEQSLGFDTRPIARIKQTDSGAERVQGGVNLDGNDLYAHAQLLQRIDVSTPQFIIASARHALQATLY